eukprot:scaffold48644_cov31-Tisochrysis_lutea.AAC.3
MPSQYKAYTTWLREENRRDRGTDSVMLFDVNVLSSILNCQERVKQYSILHLLHGRKLPLPCAKIEVSHDARRDGDEMIPKLRLDGPNNSVQLRLRAISEHGLVGSSVSSGMTLMPKVGKPKQSQVQTHSTPLSTTPKITSSNSATI